MVKSVSVGYQKEKIKTRKYFTVHISPSIKTILVKKKSRSNFESKNRN